MTIWIDRERCVVVLAVSRPQAGCTVVYATMLKRCLVKSVYGNSRRRSKSEMKAVSWGQLSERLFLQGEVVSPASHPITNSLAFLAGTQIAPHANIAKGGEHSIIKPCRQFYIPHTQRNMMKHSNR